MFLGKSLINMNYNSQHPFEPFKIFYNYITSGEYSGVLFALVTFMIIYSIFHIGGKRLIKNEDRQLNKLVNIISFSLALITSAGAYAVFSKFKKFNDIFWLLAGFFGFLIFNYLGVITLKRARDELETLKKQNSNENFDDNLRNNENKEIERTQKILERGILKIIPNLTLLVSAIFFFLAGISLFKFAYAFGDLNGIDMKKMVEKKIFLEKSKEKKNIIMNSKRNMFTSTPKLGQEKISTSQKTQSKSKEKKNIIMNSKKSKEKKTQSKSKEKSYEGYNQPAKPILV